MKEVLTYDDVLLVPQYSTIRSRCEVDTSTDLQEKLIQAGLQNKVERAKDVGSIAHANLEKEAFAYLQCKS